MFYYFEKNNLLDYKKILELNEYERNSIVRDFYSRKISINKPLDYILNFIPFNKVIDFILIQLEIYSLKLSKNPDLLFCKYNSSFIPWINPPSLFKESMYKRPSEYIYNIILKNPIHSLKNDIINESIFNDRDYNYQTIMKDGKSIISGSNEQNFRSLFGIAHELGHCLLERHIGEISTNEATIYSEIFAYLIETDICLKYLKETNQSIEIFLHYQHKSAYLNAILCILEMHYLAGKKCNFDCVKLFEPGFLLIRKILFYRPGYHIVYVISAIIKDIYFYQGFMDSQIEKIIYPFLNKFREYKREKINELFNGINVNRLQLI
jgi:hypothetical protein